MVINALQSVKAFLRSITVEPVIFLLAFGYSTYHLIHADFFLERACRRNLGYSETICSQLSKYHDIELEVQKITSPIFAARSYIFTGLSLVFSLFFGSWSDKFSRKVPLVVPLLAYFVTCILLIGFSYWEQVPVEGLLVATAFSAIGGGVQISLVAGHSYVSDISQESSRTMRISLVQFLWLLGKLVGTYGSGQLLQSYGHVLVFSVSSMAFFLGFIYGICFVDETIVPREKLTTKMCLPSFFDFSLITSMFRTAFKRRDGWRREAIIVIVITVMLYDLGDTGKCFRFL